MECVHNYFYDITAHADFIGKKITAPPTKS